MCLFNISWRGFCGFEKPIHAYETNDYLLFTGVFVCR